MLSAIWELSQHMTAQHTIRISYCRQDGAERAHEVNPVAIMFSEYYLYLIAYLADGRKEFPPIFRIDRIVRFEPTGETFRVTHSGKFSDGEFRKRIQFMYAGELRRVTFDDSGASVEAVLDRLPTAKVVSEKNGVSRITAEVYGNGIDMWLRSQGSAVKVVYQALLLYYVAQSPTCPPKIKAGIIGALGYLISPFDLIPDIMPGIGIDKNFI
jgi:hypothetical protein CLOST_1278